MVGINREGVAAGLPTFVVADGFSASTPCVLDEHAARHMRVLRLQAGALVGLRDGRGTIGKGQLVRLTKSQAHLEVLEIAHSEPPAAVHMLVPVADRDRMLWLAEKAGELGCTSWRPVMWRRSRSVSPRGEGMSFQQKVRARMEHAMAQSEGAWLPQLFPEASVDRAILASPDGLKIVLDAAGVPFTSVNGIGSAESLIIVLGPEGGIEDDEMKALTDAGFIRASMGVGILRFETAGTVALGIARTTLAASSIAAAGAPSGATQHSSSNLE